MLPYTDLPYFVVILVVALPTLVLGMLGRARAVSILVAAVLMACVHHGSFDAAPAAQVGELGAVAAFAVFQLTLVLGFAQVRSRTRSRTAFVLAIAASLAPLLTAKLGLWLRVGGPAGFVGISYVTFRALDALISVQDGLLAHPRPQTLLAYLFFPASISAGPIDRHRRFAADFEGRPAPREFFALVEKGVGRLFDGLLFKFVIAATLQDALDPLESAESVLGVVAYMYVYSAFLYFDFAGYSAIAVGVSHFFGVRTPENFDRPYLAIDIADFWNRWHISLSTWFRDHVYMRFVMAATRGRWFGGNRYVASSVGFLITFGLMGAWHGTGIRFLAYGVYHALLLIGHQGVVRWRKGHPELVRSRAWEWLGRVATLNAVCFGFLIFSGRLG